LNWDDSTKDGSSIFWVQSAKHKVIRHSKLNFFNLFSSFLMNWRFILFLHVKLSENFSWDGHSSFTSNFLIFAYWKFFNEIAFTLRSITRIVVITFSASLSSTSSFSKFSFQCSNLFSKIIKLLSLTLVNTRSVSKIFFDVVQHKWNWVLLSSFRSEESKGHWLNNWINLVVNVLFIKFLLNFSFLCSFFIISHSKY